MVPQTIEERVARLEQQITRLRGGRPDERQPAADDWTQTVGMFRGDPIVEEMIDEARRTREVDRRLARDGGEPKPE